MYEGTPHEQVAPTPFEQGLGQPPASEQAQDQPPLTEQAPPESGEHIAVRVDDDEHTKSSTAEHTPPDEQEQHEYHITPSRPSEQGQGQHAAEEQPATEHPEEQPPTAEHESTIDIVETIERARAMQDKAHEVLAKGHQRTSEISEGILSLTSEEGWVRTELLINSARRETLAVAVNGGELRVSKVVITEEGSTKIGVNLDQASSRISGDLGTFDKGGAYIDRAQPLTDKHISDVLNVVLGKLEEAVEVRELHASDKLDQQVADILGLEIVQ